MSDTVTAPQRYRVTAPMVNVRAPGGLLPIVAGRVAAWVLLAFYRGAPLPDGVHPDDIAHHLEAGMIEPIE